MAKAAKKKPARKRSTKPADGGIEAKRAKAYHDMEPLLRDCERWSELAEVCRSITTDRMTWLCAISQRRRKSLWRPITGWEATSNEAHAPIPEA
jgi:hypothetical protein